MIRVPVPRLKTFTKILSYVVFVLGLVFFFLKQNGPKIQQTHLGNPDPRFSNALDSPKTFPTPSTLAQLQKIESQIHAPPLPTSSNKIAPYHPEGNLIAVQIHKGWAIAYGDLLVGKPEAGSKQTKGVYEAPQPQLWEKSEIPYVIQQNFPQPDRVVRAIDYFNANTPVRFVPFNGQPDALVFEVGEENCYSYLGRIGGAQPIRLSAGCGTSEIIHEIMHALGFVHEQSRTDRDQYLEIFWDNIEERFRPQFAVVPESFMEASRGAPFDFKSIMLYKPDAFARDPNKETLRSIKSDRITPMSDGLSGEDIKRLQRLYHYDSK